MLFRGRTCHPSDFLVRDPIASPARYLGGQVHVPPLRMERWLLEQLESIEIIVDEPLDTPEVIAVLWPIVAREHSRNADAVDRLPGSNQLGVVVMGERRGYVVVCKLAVVIDRDEMKPWLATRWSGVENTAG